MNANRNVVKISVAVAVCALFSLAAIALRPAIGYDSPYSSPAPSTPPPMDLDPVTTPSASAPVPRGSGSRAADDVNGDDYADLVFAAPAIGAPSTDPDGDRSTYLGVVYGSARGLDPTTRTVIKPDDTRLPSRPPPGGVPTADLDGDGYADILAGGHVIWGGPTGPRDGVPAAKLGGVPGDFDGDGQQDLAVTEAVGKDFAERYQLRVLYGPFTREGKPRLTGGARPSPIAEAGLGYEDADFSLTAGDADGDRATDFVASAHGDDEQEPAVLLHGGDGPGGYAAQAPYLRTGSSVAFGDFDATAKATSPSATTAPAMGSQKAMPRTPGSTTLSPSTTAATARTGASSPGRPEVTPRETSTTTAATSC